MVSMTAASSPAATIARSAAWRAGASGVVAWAAFGSWTPPIRVAAVPIIPVRIPAASSAATARNDVVVLPSVPVIPTTPRPRSDRRTTRQPRWPARPALRPPRAAGAPPRAAVFDQRGRSPLRGRLGDELVTVDVLPGIATNSQPGPTALESWVTPRIAMSARPAAPMARPSRRAPRSRPSRVRRSIRAPSGAGPRWLSGPEELGERRLGHRRSSLAQPAGQAAEGIATGVEDALVGAGQLQPAAAEAPLVLVEAVQRITLARLAARPLTSTPPRSISVQPSRIASWIARQRSRWSAPGWSRPGRGVVARVDGREAAAVAVDDQPGERFAAGASPWRPAVRASR